jgi:hypothetical protein
MWWVWKRLSAYRRITVFVLKWNKLCFTEVRYTVTKFLSSAKHVPRAEKFLVQISADLTPS